MTNIKPFSAFDIFYPDYRYQKLLNYKWREYVFHLFNEAKQNRNYIFISMGDLVYPFIIDIRVLFDFQKSGKGMEIEKHLFDDECLQGICNEIKEWMAKYETQNQIQESIV